MSECDDTREKCNPTVCVSIVQENPIHSANDLCLCGESYTCDCLLASFEAQTRELPIGLSSSDNSTAAGARKYRKYGHGSSSGVLGQFSSKVGSIQRVNRS